MKRRMVGGQIEVSRGGQFREDSPDSSETKEPSNSYKLSNIIKIAITSHIVDGYLHFKDLVFYRTECFV